VAVKDQKPHCPAKTPGPCIPAEPAPTSMQAFMIETHLEEMAMPEETRIQTFAEFYPFYLDEHTNRTSRRLHFVGSSIGLVLLTTAATTGNGWLIPLSFLQGYAFAWVGHFFFEHNRPATFKYPLFSFMGDWRMWWDILRGRIHF